MNTSPHPDILLVEDNTDDLELSLLALRKMNLAHGIQVARDGVEALDFIFCRGAHAGRRIENAPRLVLLDLKLPKVDGLEVLRSIKADPRTRNIPVVMLTSSNEQRDVVRSRVPALLQLRSSPRLLKRWACIGCCSTNPPPPDL